MFRTLVGKIVVGLAILSAPASTEVNETKTQSVVSVKTVVEVGGVRESTEVDEKKRKSLISTKTFMVDVGGMWDDKTHNPTHFSFMVVYSTSPPKYKSVKVVLPVDYEKEQIAQKVRDEWNEQHDHILKMHLCEGNEHIFKLEPIGSATVEVKDIVIIDKYGEAHQLSTSYWSGLPDGPRIKLHIRECPLTSDPD